MWLRVAKNITSGKNEILAILDDKSRLQIVYEISKIPKIQPIVAFFLNQGETKNNLIDISNKLELILEKKPLVLQASKKGVQFGERTYDNFISFSEEVHSLFNLINPKKEQNIDESLLNEEQKVKNGIIEVKKINNANDARIYGSDQSWCIAQYGNTYWQSYRDTKSSTFYFIFDGTRPEGDPLRKVAIDVNENGVELTDETNNTGTIAQFGENWKNYFKYLQSKGIDTSQFINSPKTPQEQEEQNVLGDINHDLQWFMGLSYEHKSKYIGRGHELSDEQFDYLYNNKAYELINQYLNTGIPINSHQESKLSGQLQKTYDRKTDQFIEEIKRHPDWFYNGGLGYARGNINFIKKLHRNDLLGDIEPNELINTAKDNSIDLIELRLVEVEDLIENSYNLSKETIVKLINLYDIEIEEFAYYYDKFSPDRTIDLLSLGAVIGALFNIFKPRSWGWSTALNENHIAVFIDKYKISINTLVSIAVDSSMTKRTFFALINHGGDVNRLLSAAGTNFDQNEVRTLIQQYGADPNSFIRSRWDMSDQWRTLFLIEMGAEPLHGSLNNLSIADVQRAIKNGVITDLNKLTKAWRPAPWNGIELIKLGADPQVVLDTGLNTKNWFANLQNVRPDLISEFMNYGIDIQKITKQLDLFDSTGEIDLDYSRLSPQASFNFKKHLMKGRISS